MAYRTGAAATAYPPNGMPGGTGSTAGAPRVYPVARSPRRPRWGDEESEDPNDIGIGTSTGERPGYPGGSAMPTEGPVKLDPFADVNYQGLVSALARGEDEARNDATFQSNQIDSQLSRALAELQRAYGERRGNLTTNMRTRGAYDSSQRAALTGKLYEGEQRDADGARFDATGRKSAIQMALARLMADYGAQRSRGALDAAGRLQAAEDARMTREQMRLYQENMSRALQAQQSELLAALEALMGGSPSAAAAGGGSRNQENPWPSAGAGNAVVGGTGGVVAGALPRNAFGARRF